MKDFFELSEKVEKVNQKIVNQRSKKYLKPTKSKGKKSRFYKRSSKTLKKADLSWIVASFLQLFHSI